MDPITATILALGAVASIDELLKALQFIRRWRRDPRTEGLHVRLITERARFAEWKRRMGLNHLEDLTLLLEKFPEDTQTSLLMILLPIEKYLKESQKMLDTFGICGPDQKTTPFGWKVLVKRLGFHYFAEDDLSVLLDTLKHCNDGLLTIAPPPPGYSVSLLANGPMQQSRNQAPAYVPQEAITSQQPPLDPPARQDQAPPVIVHDLQGASVFRPVIQHLYSTALDVLRSARVQYPSHKLQLDKVIHRLSLWGSGMFKGLITLDQALNRPSDSIVLLRNNIIGILAEVAITLEVTLSILGESTDSILRLKLNSLFSNDEIAQWPFHDEAAESDVEDEEGQSSLEECIEELSGLIECLLGNLSTVEIVFATALVGQTQNASLDKREMFLLKSESDISLSNMRSGPLRELLKVDLNFIAALRESLKDSKYVEHIGQQDAKFDPKKLIEELGEEGAQIKYWTSKLAEGNQGTAKETESAMAENLARIARVFESNYRPSNPVQNLPDAKKTQALIRECWLKISDDDDDEIDENDALLSEEAAPPFEDKVKNRVVAVLDALKFSNAQFRQIAGSKDPAMGYRQDFSLRRKSISKEQEKGLNEKSSMSGKSRDLMRDGNVEASSTVF